MSAIVTRQCHRLAESLAELKSKVRAALATELSQAVGTAVRDVLIVALIDHIAVPHRTAPARPPMPRPSGWQDERDDRGRDEWGYSRDPWGDSEDEDRVPARVVRSAPEECGAEPVVPVVAAVAVGVNVGRWWLAKNGTAAAAVGLGALATGLGLVGGPVARAVLAVLAAASDVLVAESALARIDPS